MTAGFMRYVFFLTFILIVFIIIAVIIMIIIIIFHLPPSAIGSHTTIYPCFPFLLTSLFFIALLFLLWVPITCSPT